MKEDTGTMNHNDPRNMTLRFLVVVSLAYCACTVLVMWGIKILFGGQP